MSKIKEELVKMLYQALEFENSVRIQYFTRVEVIQSTLMKIVEDYKAQERRKPMAINLNDEKEAIDFYKLIHRKVIENNEELPYEFEMLENEIHNVILDKQKHLTKLSHFLGQIEERVEVG